MTHLRGTMVACAVVLGGVANVQQGAMPSVASHVYVTTAASSLVDQGVALALPAEAEIATFQAVPPPGVRNVPNEANATSDPWVDSNAWRFQRGLRKANYSNLPAGAAGLAAAEAFTFGMDAILNPATGDLDELGRVLRFLKTQEQPLMAPLANVGIIDDGTPVMGELMNMLTRRNLLYRIVAQPDRKLDVTVRLGTTDFPATAATNPSEFAARVRAKLGDDKRLVRLYGTTTAIVHLTGEAGRARLVVLSYSRNRTQAGLRIRLRGRYEPTAFAAYGTAADAKLADVEHPDKSTEFSLPVFSTIAIVDLRAVR